MANKYQVRRRALKGTLASKGTQGRSENPFAAPRSGRGTEPVAYPPPAPMDRHWLTLALSLGLVLLIVLLYVQTARHEFTVCDDNVYIFANPQIESGLTWDHVWWAFADSHQGNWHPLTWISHMLDWQLFSHGTWEPENQRYKDSWAGGHHLVSMGIHCANAVLLFLALRLMTGTLWPAFVVAALFGVHPLRVESVAWAAERKDVLCGLFWMASMLAYAFYARRPPILGTALMQSSPLQAAGTLGIYLLITLFFWMALLAKSMAVTLPCVFLLLDAWPLHRWRNALWPPGQRPGDGPDLLGALRLVSEKLPWLYLVYIDCQKTVVGQDKGVALNSWEGLPGTPRVLNALASIPSYLGQMLWPANMGAFYPHPYMLKSGWSGWAMRYYYLAALGAVVVTAITLAALWFWRKGYLAVGWFWFLGALMPVIGILQVGTQARADRYTYLPMIGVYLMIAWLLKEAADRWPAMRRGLALVAVLVFATLSAITFQQVSYWIDSYTLFRHTAEVTDNNWFAYNHIGIAYDKDAKATASLDPKSAEELFTHVARTFLWPPKIRAINQPPLPDDSPEHLQEAAKKLDLGQKRQLLFDYSAENFKESIDIKPDYDFGNNNLGVYYANAGPSQDLVKAERFFKGALMSNPRYADACNNLGIVLSNQGKLEEAEFYHLMGLNITNDRASDHNNLCRVYIKMYDRDTAKNDTAKAEDDLKKALNQHIIAVQCDPNFAPAWLAGEEIYLKLAGHKNLDQTATRQKNLDEATARQKKLDAAEACVQRMMAIDGKFRTQATITAQGMIASYYLDLPSPDKKPNPTPKPPDPKRLDRAIFWLSQILEVNKAADVYHFRGIAYGQKGDLQHAVEDFQQVLRLAPQHPGAQENLRRIQEQLTKPPR